MDYSVRRKAVGIPSIQRKQEMQGYFDLVKIALHLLLSLYILKSLQWLGHWQDLPLFLAAYWGLKKQCREEHQQAQYIDK